MTEATAAELAEARAVAARYEEQLRQHTITEVSPTPHGRARAMVAINERDPDLARRFADADTLLAGRGESLQPPLTADDAANVIEPLTDDVVNLADQATYAGQDGDLDDADELDRTAAAIDQACESVARAGGIRVADVDRIIEGRTAPAPTDTGGRRPRPDFRPTLPQRPERPTVTSVTHHSGTATGVEHGATVEAR